MKKAIQLVSIALAAYNLYILVNDFLDTPMGQDLKNKAIQYGEPYYEQAKDFAEKVMDKLEDEAPIVAKEAVNAVKEEEEEEEEVKI
jgi:hypothetical protein